MAEAPDIQGHVASGFEPVREAFGRNFTEHAEAGAAFALTVDGEMVVDIWAGTADKARTEPWTRDTIVNVYSTTKGITALCAHIAADRGLLDFDAPVSEYWPEFGRGGDKGAMPVRYLLTHQAGLPVIDEALPDNAVVDWELMVAALERQAPVWEPGEKQGYHAVTYGWLVGEVVRRVTGASSLGAFLRSEVVEPLGVDFFIGTPESEHHRVAHLVRDAAPPVAPTTTAAGTTDDPWVESMKQRLAEMATPGSLAFRSLGLASAPFAPGNNDPRWRAAEIPGANGHGNARALATIYGALARGGEIKGTRLLSESSIERAAAQQVMSPDAVLMMDTRRSLGFMLPVPGQPDRRGPRAFGHAGAGGSLGYADPERGIGFGYTMNRLWTGDFMQPDPRAQNLVSAVHEALDA